MSRKKKALARRDERRRARARTWGIIALAAVVAGILVFFVTRSPSDEPLPEIVGVERPPDAGHEHVPAGTDVDYDSPAPTSGTHWDTPAPCGVYEQQPPLGAVVHTMEHGAVVLWYGPGVDEEGREELLDVMRRFDSHVIVAPNPDIESPVVATAWDRRLALDEPSDPLVREFTETYRNRGLEDVACPIG